MGLGIPLTGLQNRRLFTMIQVRWDRGVYDTKRQERYKTTLIPQDPKIRRVAFRFRSCGAGEGLPIA